MTTQQHIAFTTLLQRWNRHQDLRDARAAIPELAVSRAALDAARLDTARALAHAA